MDRPGWLRCGNCLFWREEICWHDVDAVTDGSSDDFCSNWTCRNCWQTWDDYHFKNEDGHISDPQIYTDHSKCREVKFK